MVGFARLSAALKQIPNTDAQITWHPYQLNPHVGEDGLNLRQHLMQKYAMQEQQVILNHTHLMDMAAELGLVMKMDAQMRTFNSRRAHQLLHWAGISADTGEAPPAAQTDLKRALFTTYFSHQNNIHDIDVLLDAVDAAGLDRPMAATILAEDRFKDQVIAESEHWKQQGISGVPTFIFNKQFITSGAQPIELLADALRGLLDGSLAAAAAENDTATQQ
jgi:predicted DsbA family dithiol-disulfide isomerase